MKPMTELQPVPVGTKRYSAIDKITEIVATNMQQRVSTHASDSHTVCQRGKTVTRSPIIDIVEFESINQKSASAVVPAASGEALYPNIRKIIEPTTERTSNAVILGPYCPNPKNRQLHI